MTVRQAESPARRRAVQADRRVASAILRGAGGSRVMAGAQGKGEAGTTDPRAMTDPEALRRLADRRAAMFRVVSLTPAPVVVPVLQDGLRPRGSGRPGR